MDQKNNDEQNKAKASQDIDSDAKVKLNLNENRFSVEFRIDDIIKKLDPEMIGGHCGGCDGCSGCSHIN